MENNGKHNRILFGGIAFGVVLFVGLWHLDVVARGLGFVFQLLSFIIIGFSLAFLINVPMRMIETRLFAWANRRFTGLWPRIRRPIALLLTLVLLLGILAFTLLLVLPQVGQTLITLAEEIPGVMAQLEAWIRAQPLLQTTLPEIIDLDTIDWASLGKSVAGMLKNGATSFLRGTVSAASSIATGAFNIALGIILAVYVLMGKERLSSQMQRTLRAFLPAARAQRIVHVGRTANRVFSAFISGQFLEAVILGLLFYIGMSLLGFAFAPMVSMLIGVTAFIPIFGAFIGCFVGAFMILIHQGFLTMVGFIVFFIVLQQIEGNLIYPHVVGKSVMLPGLWVLIAVTLGGNLAGIAGMLLSVPTAALLYALLREAVARRNADRDTPRPQPSSESA